MEIPVGKSSSSCLQNGIPTRYILSVLAFFGFVLNYMLRINMSIGIVAMVRRNDSNTDVHGGHKVLQNEEGEFDWDDKAQSLINGAFFWGYIFTQIPGGRLAEMFGAKYIFGLSIFFSGIVTLLVPWAAEENPTKLIALRAMLGLLEGATYPSMHAMLSKWAPPAERSRITSIVYSGAQAGTCLTLPMVGGIISRWGWRPAFYVMGSLPVIWILFWMIFAYDTPQSHPRIDIGELKYLENCIPSGSHKSKKRVPWCEILTSSAFYAIIVAALASNWGFWTLMTLLPTYMKTMLHYDIKQNSVLSAVPYLAMWFFGVAYGLGADQLRIAGILTTKNVRKLSCFICLGLPCLALFAVTFVGTDHLSTLLIFTFAVGMSGAKYSAYLSNHMDIAPNYAGTLLGIANACSTIPGWLAPLVASSITNNHQTLGNWHEVFYIASGVYAVGCVYFLIFGSGDVQPWNDEKQSESDNLSINHKKY